MPSSLLFGTLTDYAPLQRRELDEQLTDMAEELGKFSRRNARELVGKKLDWREKFEELSIGNMLVIRSSIKIFVRFHSKNYFRRCGCSSNYGPDE